MSKLNLYFILFLIILITSSCADKKSTWTIMVYMAADNNLNEQAVTDIIEMEKAVISSDINVIVQLDPSTYYSDPQTRRYKIEHNNYPVINSPVIKYMGDIDSGDFLNLADFVNWSSKKYPAKKYALIIWSHGSGWSRTDSRWIAPDQSSLNQISIAKGELRNAFQLFNEKPDILIFDACLMQTIEVLTEVYQYTDYIVGSQHLTPYEGFPYREILESWSNSAYNNISNTALLYAESHLPGGSQNKQGFDRKISVSAMKSSKTTEFINELSSFPEKWKHIANSEPVKMARTKSFGFNFNESDIDIKQFFSFLREFSESDELSQDIDKLLVSIDELFPVQISNNFPENIGTATIWFPLYPEFLENSSPLYSNLLFAETNWLIFLEQFFSE